MKQQLFESERVRLASPDPDKDAEIESAWTHSAEFLRLLDAAPARPLAPSQIKKKYEALEKNQEREFYFLMRTKADDRAIGFVRLFWVDLMHETAMVTLGIARPEDRGQGYGSEALRLILHYGFSELGLHRVGALTFEYNSGALRFLHRHGFVDEIRRRQAVQRDGRCWDAIGLGLLRAEWDGGRG